MNNSYLKYIPGTGRYKSPPLIFNFVLEVCCCIRKKLRVELPHLVLQFPSSFSALAVLPLHLYQLDLLFPQTLHLPVEDGYRLLDVLPGTSSIRHLAHPGCNSEWTSEPGAQFAPIPEPDDTFPR